MSGNKAFINGDYYEYCTLTGRIFKVNIWLTHDHMRFNLIKVLSHNAPAFVSREIEGDRVYYKLWRQTTDKEIIDEFFREKRKS